MPTLILNSNGGKIKYLNGWNFENDFSTAKKEIAQGQSYGELPLVSNGNLLFIDWIDSNGVKVTSDTIMGDLDVNIYAQWHYVIRANDYVDLHETISEKNIINSINGQEYAVTDNKDTLLNETTINPKTLEKIFTKEPYGYPNTRYDKNLLYNMDVEKFKNVFGYTDNGYARTEAYFLEGYFDFDTQEIITDENSISVDFTINYTKSKADKIKEDNIFNNHETAFFYHDGYNFPILENEGDDNLITDNFLEVKYSVDYTYAVVKVGEAYATPPSKQEYCRTQILEKSATNTKIRVKYCFRIWAGWNTDDQKNNVVLCVNSIDIRVKASTATTNSTKFSYQDENAKVGKDYAMETNELFQSMGYKVATTTLETTGIYYVLQGGQFKPVNLPDEYVAGTTYYSYEYLPIEDRISYKTYKEISSAFNNDRRIITFDLINPVKMLFDDRNKFVDGANEMRYIDTDDRFSIYDEHNNYIGDFIVIECNPIWDGSYHKLITAILVE